MRLREILDSTRRSLAAEGIPEVHLESELFIRYVLKCSKTQMFLALDDEIDANTEQQIEQVLKRRLSGEYLNYITGECEFYGNSFFVNPSVLIPRPETELVVDVALACMPPKIHPVIADVGTGSGVIAISIAKNRPDALIYATDISESALSVARENANRHQLTDNVTFCLGNLLDPLPEPADMVIANLPYVPSSEITSCCEPRLALDGGEKGLDIIFQLCHDLPLKLKKGGRVILEVGHDQAGTVTTYLRNASPTMEIQVERDLAGFERIVHGII